MDIFKETVQIIQAQRKQVRKVGSNHGKECRNPKAQEAKTEPPLKETLEIGLPEAVKLKVGEWKHLQTLDYEQLPFKCRGCHEYGHFQRNCPKTPNTDKAGEEGW